jgi:triosephosphate isomerase
MAARRPLIAGNWKMFHGGRTGVELASECKAIKRECPDIDLVVCPPYTVLAACAHELEGTGIDLGAQNLYPKDSGAFTGEISAPMLKEAGCQWVILGHSERRLHFGETDEFVGEKIEAAFHGELFPIVCVGETWEERERGETMKIVEKEVSAFLPMVTEHVQNFGTPFVIAYEPLWAIGTGRNASAKDAEEVHESIRRWLVGKYPGMAARTRIIYGGSVKPNNAAELLEAPNVDGFLIGGASLDAASFGAIARTAQAIAQKLKA